ncbi:MAG: hypothetical protein FWF23_01520 [Alphaproteobacteria bacterium]|nr:hypothetical protein [Alphaproteobacteria bacterium]MCL2505061.1 hypothetical protein [Alphaproteobacteria bacterium]
MSISEIQLTGGYLCMPFFDSKKEVKIDGGVSEGPEFHPHPFHPDTREKGCYDHDILDLGGPYPAA